MVLIHRLLSIVFGESYFIGAYLGQHFPFSNTYAFAIDKNANTRTHEQTDSYQLDSDALLECEGFDFGVFAVGAVFLGSPPKRRGARGDSIGWVVGLKYLLLQYMIF